MAFFIDRLGTESIDALLGPGLTLSPWIRNCCLSHCSFAAAVIEMTTMNAAAEAADLPPPRRFGTILVARPQLQRPSGTFRSITLRVGRKCTQGCHVSTRRNRID
jgi:hypothetical protein